MSLVRHAIRVAAVEALRGATIVGDNVLDSQNGAIDFDADNQPKTLQKKPFIALYTYDGSAERGSGASGLRDLGSPQQLMLGIEIGHAAGMLVEDPETGRKVLETGLPYTDRNVEFYLDLLAAQALAALSDPGNSWAEIWRAMVLSIDKRDTLAVRSVGGQRLAGHQIMLTLTVMRDPAPGVPRAASHAYEKFLIALEESSVPSNQTQGSLLRSFLGSLDERDWHRLQRRQGLTADELMALGHGPIAQDVNRETPPFTTGALDLGDGRQATSVSEPD